MQARAALIQNLEDFADRIASRHGALLRAYGRDPIPDVPPVPERPGRAGARTEAIARRHGAPEPAA